jgi:hypothetical protein
VSSRLFVLAALGAIAAAGGLVFLALALAGLRSAAVMAGLPL